MTSAEDDAGLRVSVVYLRPGLTFEKALRLPAGATVGAAIEASGILDVVTELAEAKLEVGVFSQLRKPADPLYDGDRVEIYRPLTIDPKEARRVRVAVRRRRKASGSPSGG